MKRAGQGVGNVGAHIEPGVRPSWLDPRETIVREQEREVVAAWQAATRMHELRGSRVNLSSGYKPDDIKSLLLSTRVLWYEMLECYREGLICAEGAYNIVGAKVKAFILRGCIMVNEPAGIIMVGRNLHT